MTHRLTRSEAKAVVDTLFLNLSEEAQKTFVLLLLYVEPEATVCCG